MLKSNYRITLAGGSFVDGTEVFETEEERIVHKLKNLKQGDLLTINYESGLQMFLPAWQILSIETTPVVEVG